MKKWEELPKYMQCPEVREYYDILSNKKVSLFLKRLFDVVIALICFVVLIIPMVIIAVMIIIDSPGGVLYRQERVTQYGKKFKIHKFRTMVENADSMGSQVTVMNDMRVTNVGKKLRRYRLDELPQLIDILVGNMSFVGTRPEATKYVNRYTPEMMATLLLPAGVTSETSILYKDEEKLLENAENVDEVYIEEILPAKMKYNLASIRKFSFWGEVRTMIKTVMAVIK